jgi:hypothetical protein
MRSVRIKRPPGRKPQLEWDHSILGKKKEVRLAAGTTDDVVLNELKVMVEVFFTHMKLAIVERLESKAVDLFTVLRAWEKAEKTPAGIARSTEERIKETERLIVTAGGLDLRDKWKLWRSLKANPIYVQRVGVWMDLFPGAVPFDQYNAKNLLQHLLSLDVARRTRKHYQTAHRQFQKWLQSIGCTPAEGLFALGMSLDAADPAKRSKKNETDTQRDVFLMHEAQEFIESLIDINVKYRFEEHATWRKQQCLEAIMVGGAFEASACMFLQRKDITEEHGVLWLNVLSEEDGKHIYRKVTDRSRQMFIIEPWAADIIRAYIADLTPEAFLFKDWVAQYPVKHSDEITTRLARAVLTRHKRAVVRFNAERRKTLAPGQRKLPLTTLHDYRHTTAETAEARGVPEGADPNYYYQDLMGHREGSRVFKDVYVNNKTNKRARRMAKLKAELQAAAEKKATPVTPLRKQG